MAGQEIAFDTDQYDQLITQLSGLISSLQSVIGSGSGSAPGASTDVLLQPDGQTWTPAADLVTAGRSFFARTLTQLDATALPELTTLRDGLVQARSIFQDTEDLVTISRADFLQLLPELRLPTPIRTGGPW